MTPLPDVIEAAADLIQFEGHWRGGPIHVEKRMGYCVHTADLMIDDGLGIYATMAVGLFLGFGEGDIFRVFVWNDTTPTGEVIDTMRRCAKALREIDGAA